MQTFQQPSYYAIELAKQQRERQNKRKEEKKEEEEKEGKKGGGGSVVRATATPACHTDAVKVFGRIQLHLRFFRT